MKTTPKRVATEKLSISLPKEMATWLRRAAAKQMGNVSQVIRDGLLPAFNARHDK